MGYIDLRFADEVAFSLCSNQPYAWSPKGQQQQVKSSKFGRLNVFGLLNLQGQLTTYQTEKSINSETIIQYLDNFADSITKNTVVVLDNATWHTAKNVQEKIELWEKQGLFIFYLPPYSPHLNFIEILWRKMKVEWLLPKDFENKQSLHKAINHIFKQYGNDRFKIKWNIEQIIEENLEKICKDIFV